VANANWHSTCAEPKALIDEESLTAITAWLRLGDEATGRRAPVGTCVRCGRRGYLTGETRVCARCYLDETPPGA